MTKTDNEWAGEVMGWSLTPWMFNGYKWGEDYRDKDGTRVRHPLDWNPDTDANDFRELLNCDAVSDKVDLDIIVRVIEQATIDFEGMPHDQPAALRRLREAMEGAE